MLNILLPCAGEGSRLNLPYSKEIHKISHDRSLIDFSFNLCLKNKKIIKQITIISKPKKKDLENYINKWRNHFKIKICYFDKNYFEWAGSILSAKKFFMKKNIVLLPDTILYEFKNQNVLSDMNQSLGKNDLCFAIKKERNKKKLSSLGALQYNRGRIDKFCDKPNKNFKNFNSYWCSFGFRKSIAEKILQEMMHSIKYKETKILSKEFLTSYFFIKNYLDLGTWDNIHKYEAK